MPSSLHEAIVSLLRRRPRLVLELAEIQCEGEPVVVGDAKVAELALPEHRADLALILGTAEQPSHVYLPEVQLGTDPDKQRTWPYYAISAQVLHRCLADVVVVAPDAAVAAWARRELPIGTRGRYSPLVIGPEQIPEPTPDIADPSLAVLAALAHGDDSAAVPGVAHVLTLVRERLDTADAKIYCEVVLGRLSEPTLAALEAWMNEQGQPYLSEWSKARIAQGRAEGKAEGKAESILHLLRLRGFQPTPEEETTILSCRDSSTLDRWLERALTASSIHAAIAET